MIYPEDGERGRGKKSEAVKSAESAGFSPRRLQDARVILLHNPDLAKSVLAGAVLFDQAQKQVADKKEHEEGERAQMDRLRQSAPDLAEPLFAAEARKRQATSGKGVLGGKPLKEKIPEAVQSQARDKAAKAAGTNPHYISDVKGEFLDGRTQTDLVDPKRNRLVGPGAGRKARVR